MPDTYTPYGSGYGGVGVHFFKTIEVPKPGSEKKKKKPEPKKEGGEGK
jgi:hypothetical protein